LFANLRQLIRYRGLIQSLVARELKARYRGSVLGFLWSFVNPLLLLLVYWFVFTTVMPNTMAGVQPYALFMFCGILPWTWFSASLTEASGSLIAGGNLIKKVMFPAEVLPIVSVLANMVHFFLGLPILIVFLIIFRPPTLWHFAWFPVAVLVQLVFTSALVNGSANGQCKADQRFAKMYVWPLPAGTNEVTFICGKDTGGCAR